MPITTIQGEWTIMMASLSLSLREGSEPIGNLTVRSKNDQPEREGWRNELSAFDSKGDYTVEQVRNGLPPAEQIQWDSKLYDALGRFEFRASSENLRFWLTIANSASPKTASDQDKEDAAKLLDALKSEIWP